MTWQSLFERAPDDAPNVAAIRDTLAACRDD